MEDLELLGWVHAAILVVIGYFLASRLTSDLVQRACAIFLLTWANLAYTALGLSLFSALDQVGWYFFSSVALALISLAVARRFCVAPGREPIHANNPKLKGRINAKVKTKAKTKLKATTAVFDRTVWLVLCATLLLALTASLLIAAHYLPNNWDSCSYRLPRAFFYLGKGNLLHFGPTSDPRLLYYPFNGALANLFLALYRFGDRSVYLTGFLAWAFAGLGVYSACRVMKTSRTGALIAGWLCILSPCVLAQVCSLNDEVLAATPILLGAVFAMLWLATNRKRFAVLAGLGAGLGAGTKLHWVFYWPFAIAVLIAFLVWALRKKAIVGTALPRLPAIGLAACAAIPLSSGFMLANYLSTGHFTNSAFNDAVLNHPFRLSVAQEELRINTARLFLSPIPDLVTPLDPQQRKLAYAKFNKFCNQYLVGKVVVASTRSPEGYLYLGPSEPNAYGYTEYTVWLGFLPVLLVIGCIVGLLQRGSMLVPTAFLISFFFYHATYSVETKYIGGIGVYYSFAAILAAAGVGPLWDWARSHRGLGGRLIVGIFVAVMATHVLLAGNLLGFGALRNVAALARPPLPDPVNSDASHAIELASQIYIPYTHWEVPYWTYMRLNPGARYTTGLALNFHAPNVLTLLPVDAGTAELDATPVRLPKGSPGLTYLGDAGADHIFARGSDIEKREPQRSGYALMSFHRIHDPTTAHTIGLRADPAWVGVNESEGIEFCYDLSISNHDPGVHHGWMKPGDHDAGLTLPAGMPVRFLSVRVRAADLKQEVRTTYDLQSSIFVLGSNEETYDSTTTSEAAGR